MSDISKIKVGSTSYDIKDADARSRIAALEAIADVYGAKNLLPTGESGTYSGLTFTVNADGSITISGTASGNVYYTVACPKLYAGDYILTGYPSSAIGMNCSLYYDEMPGSDTGDGQPFTLSQYVDNKNVYIFVLGGTNFTAPVTFYPMIRDARIKDPTYVPYSMTNYQLTEMMKEVICPVNIDKFGSYINAGGSLSDLWPYYVASIPVSEGSTIEVINPATNQNTYNRFYDNTNQPIGNVIQNPSSGSLTLMVPTGAVMLKLSMYNNSGAPRLKIS